MQFLSVFFAIAALGFAAEAMGLFAHELNTAAAAVLLLMSAALDPGLRRGPRPPRGADLVLGAAAAVLGLALLPAGPAGRFFAVAVWFWGLDRIRVARGAPAGPMLSLAVASVCMGLFRLATHHSLLGWYGEQRVSAALSGTVAGLTGQPVDFGPTFTAVDAAVLCGVILLSAWTLGGFRRVPRFGLALVGVAVTYAAYLLLLAYVPAWLPAADRVGQDVTVEDLMAGVDGLGWWLYPLAALSVTFPLHLSWIAVLLPAAVVAWCLRRDAATAPSRPLARGPLAALPVCVLGVLAVWCLTNLPGPALGPGLQVAFYKEGFLNWMFPNHQRYGSRSTGMFGNLVAPEDGPPRLPPLMECMGWKGELIERIDAAALDGKDMLVIINQKDPLPRETLNAIDAFVDRGGSLLVLGDHTFAKSQQQMWLDQPIERTDIRFEFDSADYFIGGWLHSLRYWPHAMTAGIADASNEAGSVVGASLRLEYPAAPIIIGRYGYSDAGDWQATHRGFLGDMNPNAGERIGDVVLVAAQNVGRGRVVVVGDTSGFVNAIQTQTWPFVVRVFHWLGSRGRAAIPAWRDVLGIVLLAVIVLAALWLGRCRSAGLAVTAAVLVAATGVSSWALRSLHAPPPLRGDVAVVDLSHVGLHSLEGWRDTAINGVYLNLMREGYFAFGLHDFDPEQIRASKLFVTLAPTRPYDRGELAVLREYMNDGGTVLLAAGWEQRAGAESLLEMAELDVTHHPLGRAPGAVPGAGVEATFWKAWAVRGGETLVSLRERPVIVRKRVGRGQLLLIGDSDFLLNKNLEVEDGAILGNVRFFQWLLGTLRGPQS